MIEIQGHTHLMIGVGAGLLMSSKLGSWGIAMTAIGSLLPDLDHPKSILGRRFPLGSALGIRHRGWMHSLLGLAIFSYLTSLINPSLAPGITLGYMLHLLADSFNPAGIAWFYPISKKRIHIIGIRTGSVAEYVINLIIIFYITSLILF